MAHAAIAGDFLLQGGHFRAEDDLSGGQHAGHRFFEVGLKFSPLAL